MANYTKNSVKLLQKIENHNNNTYFYTEFDGKYDVGDILYISVKNNSGGVQNNVDSFYVQKGYELISKKGNRIELDIAYNGLKDNGITSMPSPTDNNNYNEAYIGRVYVNNAKISRGNINSTILNNVNIEPTVRGDVNLIQAILVSIKEINSEKKITNIDFDNKYTDDTQILKSEYTLSGDIESYYTNNNGGFGISYINLSDDIIELENCNINSGIFRDCILNGTANEVNNGYLEDCNIDDYVINNGYFNNCILNSDNTWNYGFWFNSGETGSEFQVTDWLDGVWVSGLFPSLSNWHDGVFMAGKFGDDISVGTWHNGEFQSGTFSNSVWDSGIFNSGLFELSEWNDGEFYDGQMVDSTWNNGVFHNGTMYSSDDNNKSIWNNGTVHDGSFLYIIWENGTVNNGDFFQCDWINGVFNNGQMLECNWTDGEFYDGIIQGFVDTISEDGSQIDLVSGSHDTYIKDAVNKPYYFHTVNVGESAIITINGVDVKIKHDFIDDGMLWDVDSSDLYYFSIWVSNDQTITRYYNNESFDITMYDGSSGSNHYYFTIKANNDYFTLANTWENGKFFNGTMLDMNWSKGIVYNGIFYNVEWVSGTWYNGTSVDSRFNKVDWYNGVFNSTNTRYHIEDGGTDNPADDTDVINAEGIIRGGTWYNGVFNNGVFGIDTDANIDAIWEKGNFYNGIYNGDVWKGGLFYKGIISIKKFIPERYKVNRDYQAYNMDKIKKRKFTITRKLKMNFRRKISKYITPRTSPRTSASTSASTSLSS